MYIFQNALQNLLRNRGRNLMMGAIIFVIIVSVVTALMINNTANGVINDYKERFGSEVSFVPNQKKWMEEAVANSTDGYVRLDLPKIKPELLLALGESEYLKDTVYAAETKANSKALRAIDANRGGGGGSVMAEMGPNGLREAQPMQSSGGQYYHKLTNQYADFDEGLRALTEGSRYPENDNECIMSEELLKNSGLAIGDTLKLTSALEKTDAVQGEATSKDISWEMTIVGTYTDFTTEYSENLLQNAYNNRRNEILTTFEAISNKMQDGMNGINLDARFTLTNPEVLEDFIEEVREKGLSKVFDIAADTETYNRIIGPVEGLKSITFTFVIVVIVLGAIILALLASIAIRERKYEIGVLRAMGMKKMKVVLGLWFETLAITIACLIFGLGIGPLIAQPVTNAMLENQIATAQQSQQKASIPSSKEPALLGTPQRDTVKALSELDVSLDIETILEIIVIALVLSSFAGIVATCKITKYEPIKILMERN